MSKRDASGIGRAEPGSPAVDFSGMKSVHFPPGHPAAEGHFPGNPIIPGAVLLREVVAAIAPDSPVEILWAKFHVPVRPGNTIEIQWANAASEVRFRCSISGSDRPAVTGALGRTSS
jgi:3-hydroxyacyl-[acyl-carrier-protein] dehydratase